MTIDKIYKLSKVNPLLLLLGVGVIFISLLWIAKGLFTLFNYISPFLLIAAVFLNYRVVLGYGKWLLTSIRRNPVFGIAALVLTILGHPFVTAFLFFRSLSSRGLASSKSIGEYVNYETVEEDDFLDLSDVKEKGKKMNQDYNDVF